MSRVNTATRRLPKLRTHEGAPAARTNVRQQLRRSVMACLLWEDQFYESGVKIADRIKELAAQVAPDVLAEIAIEAREVFNLRHVPLLLVNELSKKASGREDGLVAATIARVIKRADELAELLAIYWADGGHRMVSAGVRKGLARAIQKFDEYQLAKYDRDSTVKLRDVFRIVRPKPVNDVQSALFKRVVKRDLEVPDTWEVALTRGADKKETFTRLIREGNLGYFALLRNLRNMAQSGVDTDLVEEAILARKNGAQRILPFRYTAAARAVPQFEPVLDKALLKAIEEMPQFDGTTVVLVDISGSMDAKLSAKSDLTRADAAATLAAIVPGKVRMFSFSNDVKEVPSRKGMAGVDAILRSQSHGGTYLGKAIEHINRNVPHDRLIVVTDEQSHDRVPDPVVDKAYMINVASYQNGVGYGKWVHLDGFSESVLRFIMEFERSEDT